MGTQFGTPSTTQLNYYVGPGIELRSEVGDVKRALVEIGIDLDDYGITIVGVTVRPRPIGFDFRCAKSDALLKKAKELSDLKLKMRGPFDYSKQPKPALGYDDPQTAEGSFMSGQTHGSGFRQPGAGRRSLHLEVALDGNCNAHIDTHGVVSGNNGVRSLFDFNGMLEHGYFDLLSDKAPGLFGAFGKQGLIGPMIEPMKGVDGEVRFVFGLKGHW